MSKRVFDSYHAPDAETDGVKAALDAAGIAYHETHKGKWGIGSAGIWVSDSSDYQKARAVIDAFQRQWVEQARQQVEQQNAPPTINWARIPALVIVIGAVLYLTFFWYF